MDIIIGMAAMVALIITGYKCIYQQDQIWELKRKGIRAQGLTPKRTDEWENLTAWLGVFLIGVGVIGFLMLTVVLFVR